MRFYLNCLQMAGLEQCLKANNSRFVAQCSMSATIKRIGRRKKIETIRRFIY